MEHLTNIIKYMLTPFTSTRVVSESITTFTESAVVTTSETISHVLNNTLAHIDSLKTNKTVSLFDEESSTNRTKPYAIKTASEIIEAVNKTSSSPENNRRVLDPHSLANSQLWLYVFLFIIIAVLVLIGIILFLIYIRYRKYMNRAIHSYHNVGLKDEQRTASNYLRESQVDYPPEVYIQ